jgi:endonuclease/exonuclease/phosphatase family metal-dependent hydrolase
LPRPLRVLSPNIWYDSGPWPERRSLICDWIRRLDPDLIGLQEVLVGEGTDQIAELVGELGLHSDSVPSFDMIDIAPKNCFPPIIVGNFNWPSDHFGVYAELRVEPGGRE